MKEVKSNTPMMSSHSKNTLLLEDMSRDDKLTLIKQTRLLMDSLDYVSLSVFANVTERLAEVFILSRGLKPSESLLNNVIYHLMKYARRSTTEDGKWFAQWVDKVTTSRIERKPHRVDIHDQILKETFPKVALEVQDFGWLHTSERGSAIYMGSESGFFYVFENEHDLRRFALNLIEAASEIEHSRTVITSAAIPEGYEEIALEDISDQIVADGWLYGSNDTKGKD